MGHTQKNIFRVPLVFVASSWMAVYGSEATATQPPFGANPSRAEVVCSYAPSQSKLVAGTVGTAGGGAAATAAIAEATGLTVVSHSSGALILTGSGGYVSGTLGTAIAGPVIVGVGLVVGGAAVTVELLCAPINHPSEVKRVKEASAEFKRRYDSYLAQMKRNGKAASLKISAVMGQAGVEIKRIAGNAFDYAFGTKAVTPPNDK